MIKQETILQLSISEKLQLMELLWADLSRDENSIEIPGWQKNILDNRMARIESGEAQYNDWDKAKHDIMNLVNEN